MAGISIFMDGFCIRYVFVGLINAWSYKYLPFHRFLYDLICVCAKPACLEWNIFLSCVIAPELLQNYSLSSVSPPQTVQQYNITFYCLCVHPTWFICGEDFIVSVSRVLLVYKFE